MAIPPSSSSSGISPTPEGDLSKYWIPLSFFAIYFIWGSTFLANDWAFDTFPPFLLSSIRFLCAGGLLYLFSGAFRQGSVSRIELRNAVIMGICMLGIGTGSAMWAIQFLDTGIVALVIGGQPLLVVLLSWMILSQRPGSIKWLGVALGLAGMITLVSQESLSVQADSTKGFIAILIAMFSWSISAIYFKRIKLPESKAFSASIQMASGGLFLLLISLIANEDPTLILERASLKAFISAGYLIIFGSLIAYSAFNYLLSKVDPAKVTTTNYVNPVIALLLGWGLNGEIITQQSLLAAALLISGVVFINSDRKLR